VRIKPYADSPVRGSLQVLADLAVVVWIIAWIVVGRLIHDVLEQTAKLGYGIRDGSSGIASGLRRAGDEAAGVPLVGDRLQSPFSRAGDAAGSLAETGQQFGDRLTWLALPLGVLIAVLPVLAVLAIWAPLRWRFARQAGATAELAVSPAGQSVLALRALATQPVHKLTSISADPVAAWRAGDAAVIDRLAGIEMRRRGVRRRRILARS